MTNRTGAMNLDYTVAGGVAQALAEVLVYRGHDWDDVRRRLAEWAPKRETRFWDTLDDDADELAEWLGLSSYPDEP
jgi:hypothetical protein